MTRKLILFFTITLLSLDSFSQDKSLSLNEIFTNRSIYALSPSQLKWIGSTDEFCFEEANTLYKMKAGSNEKKNLISLSEINDIIKKEGITALNRFPEINWFDNTHIWFLHDASVILIDLIQKKVVRTNKYAKECEEEHVAPQTLQIAYTKDNNLYVSVNSSEKTITNDENKGIVNGKAAHRNEFGIKEGIFWNHKGTQLAFYRVDETMVTDYPLVTISELSNRIAELKSTKYPMAGMKSHHASVGIYDISSGNTIYLKTGEPLDQYLTNITWSNDDKYIYIAILNREQNHMKLQKYTVSDGSLVTTLFEEKNEKYIEPEHGPIFLPNEVGSFFWFSKRDGWNHLYMYNQNGELIKQITKGKFDVQSLVGIDAKGKNIYFMAAHPTPVESQLFSCNIETTELKKVTLDRGVHTTDYNQTKELFIDIYSNLNVPNHSRIIDNKGKTKNEIKIVENPLKDYKKCDVSIFPIKATDGSDLWCRLIKPADFNPTKKYPVFFYVYGGPHLQMIQEEWNGGADMFMYYMAQQGFVVFSLDNHGTPWRGLEFEQAIFRNLGSIEVDDQLKGVEYLKSLPWVDEEKFSIQGWSYGGFMTLNLMLKHPGIFKVAIAGGPVVDWQWYEVMYGERYMDTPDENPIGYKNACMTNYVNNLKGKLMVIHGSVDPTVVPQHSLSFLKKCVSEGVQIDFFLYPEHEHNVRGKDRMHLYKKIEQYIKDYIKN